MASGHSRATAVKKKNLFYTSHNFFIFDALLLGNFLTYHVMMFEIKLLKYEKNKSTACKNKRTKLVYSKAVGTC